MKSTKSILAVSLGLAFASAAHADPVYNTSVNPGWYIGSGQPNSGFVTNTAGGTELGLNAMYRWFGGQNNSLGPVAGDTGPAVYVFDPGPSATSGSDPTPVPNLAKWNFRLHGNFGTYTSSTAVLELDVDWDPSAASSFTSYNLSSLAPANTPLIQASENLGFAYWGQSFDPNAAGIYDFRLRLLTPGGDLINSVAMQVQVIPLPPAAWAGLSTLAGIGFVGFVRRRRQIAQ